MKKIIAVALLILLMGCVTHAHAQDINASTIRLGPFYIGMKLSELQTVSGRKISKSEMKAVTDDYEKVIEVMFDQAVFEIDFYPGYSENGVETEATVSKIVCKDQRVKTKSGITIGANKFDLLRQLSGMNVNFSFNKNKAYDSEGKPTQKFIESFSIMDYDAGSTLTLIIENDKVIAFTIFMEEGC